MVLAEACQVGCAFSFLGIQERKRLAKERRRARETPGFPLRISSLQRGCGPSDSREFIFLVRFESKGCTIFGNALFLVCECARFWLVYNDFRAEQQTFGLVPAKSKFPLEISLRGGHRCLWELSPHHCKSPARTFAEQKCLAAVGMQSLPLGNWIARYRTKAVKPVKQQREYSRYLQVPSTSTMQKPRTPRISKGPKPFCFLRDTRSKSNFFLAARHHSSLRS